MRSRLLGLGSALAVLAACNGDGPSSPSSGQDVRGTYLVDHVITVVFAGAPFAIECTGSVVIGVQQGTQFQGSMTLDPCEVAGEIVSFENQPLAGSVTGAGSIRFTVLGLREALEAGLEEEGCEVVRLDDAFQGTVSDARLTAELTADVQCEGVGGTLDVSWRIEPRA